METSEVPMLVRYCTDQENSENTNEVQLISPNINLFSIR